MRVDHEREDFERLLLRLSTDEIGDDGEFVLERVEPRAREARISYRSRPPHPVRAAGMMLDAGWLEAFFFVNPNLSILVLDDFADGDYATEQVRHLVQVVHAYLRGEGVIESRRTIFGRRRSRLVLQVNGRRWVAR